MELEANADRRPCLDHADHLTAEDSPKFLQSFVEVFRRLGNCLTDSLADFHFGANHARVCLPSALSLIESLALIKFDDETWPALVWLQIGSGLEHCLNALFWCIGVMH